VKHEPILENPPRLVIDGAHRELLQQAGVAFRQGLDERRAFHKLDARLSGPWFAPRGWQLGLSLAVAALVLTLGLVRAWRDPAAEAIAPESSVRPRPGHQRAPEVGQRLSAGSTEFADGVVVSVQPAGVVSLLADGSERRFRLSAGAASFRAKPGLATKLRVVVGPYELSASSSAFSAHAGGESAELIVATGAVTVERDGLALATVGAGQSWSGSTSAEQRGQATDKRLAPPAPDSGQEQEQPEPSAEQASPSAAPDCRELARQADRAGAIACYEQQARGAGLSAEVASYQLGRLKREAGDLGGAIGQLQAHRGRFPAGSLQGEVALTLVELYAASGRAREALAESDQLLDTRYGRERAEQLHWLRGNLFRESLGDYVQAQAEYEQINPGAKLGGEALYFTAVCLEKRGQREAARLAYEQYTRHPNATRRAAAQKKMESLTP
jgi:hypothetical protein